MHYFNIKRKWEVLLHHTVIKEIGSGLFTVSNHTQSILLHYQGPFSRSEVVRGFALYMRFKDVLYREMLPCYITLRRSEVLLVIKDGYRTNEITYDWDNRTYRLYTYDYLVKAYGMLQRRVLCDETSNDYNSITKTLIQQWKRETL